MDHATISRTSLAKKTLVKPIREATPVFRKLSMLAVAVTIAATTTVIVAPAAAAQGPVFTVMNTSEEPPDGVYYRSAPDMSTAVRITGFGVFQGERVSEDCYAWGTAVGTYQNRLWYYTHNVSRTVVGDRSNEGWLNAHYINDGVNANEITPGVSLCGGTTPAPPTPPAPTPSPTAISVFMSPYNPTDGKGKYSLYDQSVRTITRDNGGCSTNINLVDRVSNANPNTVVTTLSGWSCGRLAVEKYLAQASDEQLRKLDYVLMIDPGGSELIGSDDTNQAAAAFTRWFGQNSNARMVILAGSRTYAYGSYFGIIRTWGLGNLTSSHTKVCTYNTSHEVTYFAGQYWIQHKINGGCPWLNYGGTTYKPITPPYGYFA